MPPRALKSTRSTANSRVSLITEEFTSLRRSTRSTSASAVSGAPSGPSKLNLSGYAYSPPRKRLKTEIKEETPQVKVEVEELVKLEPEEVVSKPSSSRSASKLPKAARTKAHPEPPRWREQYALIEKMRAGIVAPVDTMGCERPRSTEGLDDKTLRFHILISLMLSSQTKDAVTSQAVLNLHQSLPGGLTASSLAAAPSDVVADSINKVGFWRRKTEYIQDAARKLLERDGDVPQTIEELCELRGVGPKMGFLALQAAWNINAGIGVDVHVHRITNRLKWHKPPTKTPEETRVNLESWLPPEYHRPINRLLVGFGQVICLPVGPRCDVCLLAKDKLCPSRVAVNPANRKEISYSFADGGAKVEIGYEVESGAQLKEVVEEVKAEVKDEMVAVAAEMAEANEPVEVKAELDVQAAGSEPPGAELNVQEAGLDLQEAGLDVQVKAEPE